jgi:hypothetical protein
MGYKASKRPLMLSKFFTSGRPFRPHFGRRGTAFHASRRLASSASGGSPDFTMQFGRQRVHRGAAIQIKRILNLTDNPIFGKKYRQFSRAVIAGSATASSRSLLDETGLPLFRTLRPPSEDE